MFLLVCVIRYSVDHKPSIGWKLKEDRETETSKFMCIVHNQNVFYQDDFLYSFCFLTCWNIFAASKLAQKWCSQIMSQKSSTIAQKSSLEFSSKVTVNSFNDYHDFFSYTWRMKLEITLIFWWKTNVKSAVSPQRTSESMFYRYLYLAIWRWHKHHPRVFKII